MSNPLKRLLNEILHPLGLFIGRRRTFESFERRDRELTQLVADLMRDLVFSDLPETAGRPELLGRLVGTGPAEAMYILGFLHRSLICPGDVCEFGVAQGATSALLANEIVFSDKALWLYDSFEGLPAPSEHDDLIDDIFDLGHMARYEGTMKCCEDLVRGRLAEIGFPAERTHIRKGWVEETLGNTESPERVCFAYLDFDFFEPTATVLSFLAERLSPGGHIVVDDYGFFSSGVQKAVDTFVAESDGRFVLERPVPSAGHFRILHRYPGPVS